MGSCADVLAAADAVRVAAGQLFHHAEWTPADDAEAGSPSARFHLRALLLPLFLPLVDFALLPEFVFPSAGFAVFAVHLLLLFVPDFLGARLVEVGGMVAAA